MNVLSLFSGIGGLDLGLQRAGMTIAGQVEIDPWCRKVLAKHWPEVPRHDDVRTCADWWLGLVADAEGDGRGTRRTGRSAGHGTDGQDVPCPGLAEAASRGQPRVDLVCGGFPCQPVSSAGKRLAQDDPRWLWPAMADVIRRLRPRFALMENVPGLLVRGMGDVLGDLAACGYDAEWDCVSASAVGAPHRRDRVWIIAYPGGSRQQGEPASIHQREHDPLGWSQLSRRDGAESHVADAEGRRRAPGISQNRQALPELAGRSIGLADASGAGSPDGRDAPGRRPSAPRWVEPQRLGWWATEPAVGRVAHGIPRRVDRLRGLGNAVVPQVAEHIGRLIMGAAS